MKQILQNILDRIKPTEKEEKEVQDRIKFILNKINHNLKDAKAILGGSGIKGTWLKPANDADIFVRFNYKKYKDRSSEISAILENTLKKKNLKVTKLHGSRDYFQIIKQGFTFEIVPILDIKKAELAKNITDVSPLHADWVNKKGKKIKDDIRLLKQFCKSVGIYGAESYINGFSGYICEILTIHYKGFINLVKNAAKWKDKTIIDTEKHWKGKNILMELNKSKILSPMIVIDPVQADRNAAAALSIEKFNNFREACKRFIRHPSEKFFEIKEISEEHLKKKAAKNTLILIDVEPKEGKKDVVGCKLLKSFEYIKKIIEKHDFKVLNNGWDWNKNALFYFIIKKEKLNNFIEREGPPLSNKIHVKNFKKFHSKTFVKNKNIYAKIKRPYLNPNDLVKGLAKDNYIKEKVNGIKIK
ncbi:MAG: CCA tRNA nucleotidyltransferase [Nanoarchaeota archaeon]|nr:CCA tRNA nucleotidyltransferase [Nanoarchaeota archaeon]MBU1005555.1 CCA tRNA nucleotidyltransferase [Nanoarchaeota archaeon]